MRTLRYVGNRAAHIANQRTSSDRNVAVTDSQHARAYIDRAFFGFGSI